MNSLNNCMYMKSLNNCMSMNSLNNCTYMNYLNNCMYMKNNLKYYMHLRSLKSIMYNVHRFLQMISIFIVNLR